MIESAVIKTMVEMSSTEKEADDVVMEFTPYRTSREKFEYLTELFKDRKIFVFGRCDGENGDPDLTDYQALLTTIINLKWN
jgi:hypothetical protein